MGRFQACIPRLSWRCLNGAAQGDSTRRFSGGGRQRKFRGRAQIGNALVVLPRYQNLMGVLDLGCFVDEELTRDGRNQ